MKIITGISRYPKWSPPPVVAIGVFDGLHRGHQQLIKNVQRLAKKYKTGTLVMTFDPHPVQVLRPEVKLPLLVSLEHRLKLLEEMGVDRCLVINFTKRFALQTPQKFIEDYLVKTIQPRTVIVGDDFRFGHDRVGTIETFRKAGAQYGFDMVAVHATHKGHKTVSSTIIRDLIGAGQLAKAKALLGRPVSILGKVVSGDSRGKLLGYPTANINPGQILLPPMGVYFVQVQLGGMSHFGLANIGRRPSFKSRARVNIEVHIFDFKGNIYGRPILVNILKKIRNEKFFNSRDELIAQIRRDETTARRLLQAQTAH